MTYELAKSLKDAGFPDPTTPSGRKYDYKGFHTQVNGEMVYVPVLEELIEACGEKFGGVRANGDGRYSAYDLLNDKPHETDMPHCWCSPRKDVQEGGGIAVLHNDLQLGEFGASTPTEAVAMLWLALNQKHG